MEVIDDHAEPEFRQHRPRPAARPAHRNRAAGRVCGTAFSSIHGPGDHWSRRFARDRTVYAIDGPSHGKSEAVHRDFSFGECVAAAEQALDRLGLTEPVDWVGNAWGGHVGIHLATGSRLRTLTTIGTPVQAFTLREKLTKGWPLVQMYRFTGANGFLKKQLSDSLLGAETVAAQPDQAATVIASFAEADRDGMLHAMRSMMMHRSGVEDLLPRITIPTLVMSVRDDAMGWRPDEARRTCAAIPDCRVEEVAGGGHVAPLLDRPRPDCPADSPSSGPQQCRKASPCRP